MKKKSKTAQGRLGYSVPKDYFSTTQEQMLERTLATPTPVGRSDRYFWFGIAASIALLIGLFEMEQSKTAEFDLEFESIIIESVAVEEAAFDDWFEEEYILSDY